MMWSNDDKSQNSTQQLNNFVTNVDLLIKQIQDFGDKDNQNLSFEILKNKTDLSKITERNDSDQAIIKLYDLVKNIIKLRNQDDDQKLINLIKVIINSIEKEKLIEKNLAIDFFCDKLKETLFQYFFTDWIPDLDPKWVLFLLKISWIVDKNKKFASAVGRGKISDFTTIDSGNKRLFFDAPPYGLWEWKSMDDILDFFNNNNITALMDRYLVQGARLVIDHHDRYCQSTSATHMMKVMIDAIDKLPEEKNNQIEDFVTFIDMSDDMYYQIATLDDRLSIWSLMW